jgi:hypothetical protein
MKQKRKTTLAKVKKHSKKFRSNLPQLGQANKRSSKFLPDYHEEDSIGHEHDVVNPNQVSRS